MSFATIVLKAASSSDSFLADACNIAAGPAEAFDKISDDRIADEDRNDGRCLGGRGCSLRGHVSADRYQNRGLASQKTVGLGGQALVVAVSPAELDDDILPLDYAVFGQALAKGINEMRALLGRSGTEKSNNWLVRRLRVRGERPSR